MKSLVVDASVAAKCFFVEDHSDASLRLVSARNRLLAPDLLWAEFGNLVWKRLRSKEITSDEARGIIDDFLRIPLTIIPSAGLLAPAFELAAFTGRTVYDCLYLALAISHGCRLITADERLINSLAGTPLKRHLRFVAAAH